MKEIHAYLNEDGTYRIEGIGCAMDDGKLKDASFNVPRAKITIEPLADTTGELMSLTVENNANE
jgi:hypothetical protein